METEKARNNNIFIVHGRDESMLRTVKDELKKIGLNPVILREQINGGRTIIEKFESVSNTCDFAVILMSDKDDEGYVIGHPEEKKPRARQNVILEMGYFVGKLGRRNHICILTRPNVEHPSDIMGLVYIAYDRKTNWRKELEKELEESGYILKTSARFYLNQGIDKFEKKDLLSALTDFNKAIEINPEYALAYCYRGRTLNGLEDYHTAVNNCEKAIKLDSNLDIAYYARGNAKSALGDKAGAIKDYDKAIELNPSYASAYNNRGNAKSALGDKAGAIKDYDKAIELNPNGAGAYNNRGNAKSALGDKDGAIKDYDKAIGLNPNWSYPYNGRGNAKYDLGDKDGAIKDYDKAIGLNPNWSYPYNGRGNAKYDLGDKDGAIKDYDKAIGLNPNYAKAYSNRANLYKKMADEEQDASKKEELMRKSQKDKAKAKELKSTQGVPSRMDK